MQAKHIILVAAFGLVAFIVFNLFDGLVTDTDIETSQVSALSENTIPEPNSMKVDANYQNKENQPIEDPLESYSFPVTFNHKFGTTIIKQKPKRIATLDWTGADDLLALDIQPVTVREWVCSDEPYAVCPWAQNLLSSKPTVIGRQINYEALAASKPDIIIAVWSGITVQDYKQLSKIAPVVATPKGVGDYELTWGERSILTGKAVGKENLARSKVAQVESKLAAAAKPEWKGKTAAIGFLSTESFGAIANNDPSMQLMRELGFTLPPGLIKDASNVDYLPLSSEEINRLDADILLWTNTGNDERIKALPGRKLLKAHQIGHELFLEEDVNDAFRQATVLSIPFVVDNLVPQIDSLFKADK